MPKYAKFIKVLLTNKRKLEEVFTVSLGESCSAYPSSQIAKVDNKSQWVVDWMQVGDSIVEKALADSGASINVMPYKFF